MVPHGVYMMHTCIAEIKEYDVKAHVYGMVALVREHEVKAWI